MKHGAIVKKSIARFFLIGACALFAGISLQAVHAQGVTGDAKPANHSLDQIKRTGPGCWGATCAGKDPTLMGCLTSVHFLPYKKAEYYQGQLVGYFSSIYSYTCNANWDQAELTSYAVNQGWRVQTKIMTTDSNNLTEEVVFPNTSEISYGGETGWPTVSNMVDGTNQTTSIFYLVNNDGSNGSLMTDQVQQ